MSISTRFVIGAISLALALPTLAAGQQAVLDVTNLSGVPVKMLYVDDQEAEKLHFTIQPTTNPKEGFNQRTRVGAVWVFRTPHNQEIRRLTVGQATETVVFGEDADLDRLSIPIKVNLPVSPPVSPPPPPPGPPRRGREVRARRARR